MPTFLETDRLVLRGFTEADADRLYELNSDHDVMWFLTGGEPTPREEVRSRIIPFFLGFYERYDGLGFWAVETQAAGEFLLPYDAVRSSSDPRRVIREFLDSTFRGTAGLMAWDTELIEPVQGPDAALGVGAE